MTASDRLTAQLAFLTEADALKCVERASRITGNRRRENSAEHSWHLALYALVLADQAGPGVSIDRVIRMMLIHDLVEIDAGDVPIHSAAGQAHSSAETQAIEAAAAARIFGLLPPDQARDMLALWQEFEAGESPDARFARALDRVQPVMLNLNTQGGTWNDYAVTREQLETRVGSKVQRGAPRIWAHLKSAIDAWFASPRG